MDNILQAFNDIAIVLPRVDRLKLTFRDDAHFDQAIGLIYGDILEFHQRAYKFFRCKGWHFLFAVNWGLFEKRFQSILQRLQSHCDLLDREAAAIHFSEMRDFRIKRQIEDDAFERHRHNQMAESVFRWLSAGEDLQEEYLHKLSDYRLPGTCNWLLQDPLIDTWIEGDGGDPVLWVTGIPGAGKSYLCSLIIQNLQTRQDQSSLYYFCGKQPVDGDSCAIILRTLIIQLLRDNTDAIPLAYQAYLQNASSRASPAMKNLFCQLLPVVKLTRLVIDGIDEANQVIQREVLKALLEIQKKVGCNYKLLVSSREEPQIQKTLLSKSHLKLGAKTSEGLGIYIAEKVKEVKSHFEGMEPALAAQVEKRLRSKAQGMFLWVRLVTAMLTQLMSEAEIEQAIDQLPDGLDEAYGLILSRIRSLGSISRDRVFKVLFWLCTAYRPVTTHEVADGTILHTGQRELSKRTRSSNLRRDVVDACAPLLEESKNGTLQLVHFSAKEYLIHEQSGPFVDVARANFSVALACLNNLTTSLDLVPRHHDSAIDADLETRVVKGHFGLQSYAHDFWAEHTATYFARAGEPNSDTRELLSALESFSLVSKHRLDSRSSSNPPAGGDFAAGLSKLAQYPPLYNLVSYWFLFKSKLRDTISNTETPEAQQEWRLRTDETYMSLIDSRLCKMTENILKMNSSELPPHIDKDHYEYFISRFKLPCRFFGCIWNFESSKDREAHETTHVPSYPCLQCDFVKRGFRTRKDLDRHTQKYHMCPEDFEIPADIQSACDRSNEQTPKQGSKSSSLSRCWNEQGRQVLQQGLRQVLTKVESQLKHEKDIAPAMRYEVNVDSILEKIETQQYEYLSDFKDDLHSLADIPENTSVSLGAEFIGSFCDDELGKATSEYPAFTNLDHKTSPSGPKRAHFDDLHQTMSEARPPDDSIGSPPPLHSSSSTGRAPYWSINEEKEFPEILRRCGRDFIKIADYLKTKTPAEVDRHFIELVGDGRRDLLEAANLADSEVNSLQSDVLVAQSTDYPADLDHENPDHQGLSATFGLPSAIPQSSDNIPLEIVDPQDLPVENRARRVNAATGPTLTDKSANESHNGPKTTKRKPRPRVICNRCKFELHDEYAMKRHVKRLHTETRKVWICEDISIDKSFLSKCQACLASKRYSSSHDAGKHLREAHFSLETPADTFYRWMRETEEPNPNFRTSTPEVQVRRAAKRQKLDAKAVSLPPVQFDPSSSKLDNLPSILTRLDQSHAGEGISKPGSPVPLSSDLEDESAKDSISSTLGNINSKDHDLLDHVSWDNILPRSDDDFSPTYHDGSKHRASKALIKPRHVPRLPHLDAFRKAACQDQVDAIYQRLDTEPEYSRSYEDQLENLTSLSRTLMSNLRDWRRHSSLVPQIPFSI